MNDRCGGDGEEQLSRIEPVGIPRKNLGIVMFDSTTWASPLLSIKYDG